MRMTNISRDVRAASGMDEEIAVALTQDEASILYSLIYGYVGGISAERDFLTGQFMLGLRNAGAMEINFNFDGSGHGLGDSRPSGIYIYGRVAS